MKQPVCQVCYQESESLKPLPLVSAGSYAPDFLRVFNACPGCFARYVTDEALEWHRLGHKPSGDWYENYR